MDYKIRYTNTAGILAQFYKATVCRPYRTIGIIIIVVGVLQMCGVIGGIAGIVKLDFSSMTLGVLIIMGIAELAIGVLLCCYHILMGRMALKQGKKQHGGIMPETVVELGDQMVMTEGKAVTTYDYDQISMVRETSSMFCVMLGKYAGILLPKENFEEGDPAAFAEWIKSKYNHIDI
ncbi:MAG: YcxB family protein [Eubacteriaceae bacterium]|nr:YcxB family protein [Eubacteriaceae bacterium]